MYDDYNRAQSAAKKMLALILSVSLCIAVFYYIGDSNTIPDDSVSTKVIEDCPSKQPEIPQIDKTDLLPISPVPPIGSTQPECTDNVENVDPTAEPIPTRENTLYYFMENGIRTNIPVEYQDYVYHVLKDYGYEDRYELILAMIYHESGWDEGCISGTNDYGLMQINVCNHAWLRSVLGITDFLDPYQSIDAGIYMISSLFNKYGAEQALVCYNMGEGGALRNGVTSSVYSRGVFADMELLVELES